jgi:hypothetical protein
MLVEPVATAYLALTAHDSEGLHRLADARVPLPA